MGNMVKVLSRIALVSLFIGILMFVFNIQPLRVSSSSSNYVYEIVSMGESYIIAIETDGIVSGLNYNNYSFSINWENYGTFENVTVPKSLNGTSIKVFCSGMVQGWMSPQLIANESHYIILGPDPSWGHIKEVYFGMPTVQVDLSAPTVVLGYYVNITGMVSYRGKPVNDVGVRLLWSSGGLPNEITTVVPSHDGTFLVSWIPTATGTFYIAAMLICPWLPDEVPTPQAYACLSISPPYEQTVFSVVSNSTITNLTFDSANYTLSFSASGPDGTTGYAKVFISKQLLTDITILKVYVDGNLTNYSYTATDSAWIIIVHYAHSTHQIEIIIPEIPSHKLLLALITPATIALIHKKKRSLTKHL